MYIRMLALPALILFALIAGCGESPGLQYERETKLVKQDSNYVTETITVTPYRTMKRVNFKDETRCVVVDGPSGTSVSCDFPVTTDLEDIARILEDE